MQDCIICIIPVSFEIGVLLPKFKNFYKETFLLHFEELLKPTLK
jgi:hypothetical protein